MNNVHLRLEMILSKTASLGLRELTLETIELAERRMEERNDTYRQLGIEDGLLVGSPEYVAFEQAPRPVEDVFSLFLASLPDDSLRRLHALYYAGREHEDLTEYYGSQQGERREVLRTLLCKMNLAEHLRTGIRIADASPYGFAAAFTRPNPNPPQPEEDVGYTDDEVE